jgi:hypothetical protein
MISRTVPLEVRWDWEAWNESLLYLDSLLFAFSMACLSYSSHILAVCCARESGGVRGSLYGDVVLASGDNER